MVAALLLAGLGAVAAPSGDTTFVLERGARVVVEHPDGAVRVRGVSGREARVLLDGAPRGARISRSGSDVYVTVGEAWEDHDADVLLELPRDVELTVHGIDGDVNIQDLASFVTIETVDGDVGVRGAVGVSATTADGDLHITDARGPVSAHTSDGDIRLARVAGDIEAHAIDGDVFALEAAAAVAVLSTISGTVWYEGRVVPGGDYALSSHDGDVVFALPAGAGARVSVATFDGALETSFPVQLRRASGGTSRFTVGDGAARVTLESFDGDIHLIRPGERSPEPR